MSRDNFQFYARHALVDSRRFGVGWGRIAIAAVIAAAAGLAIYGGVAL